MLIKIIKSFCFTLLIIAFAAALLGRISGDYILKSAIRGNYSFVTFIFSPSQGFIETFALLNDSSDFKRLTGYYAYKESGLVDLDFLYERYKSENSDIIKKIIIRTAEENAKKEKLVDFYKKLYNVSPENMQKLLLKKI